MKIIAKQISYIIDEKSILKDIDCEFSPAGINTIIGPNGAGKTTLLKILSLISKPTSGEIFYDDESLNRIISNHKNVLSLRRKMGFIFQSDENVFFSGDVFSNLIYPLKVRKQTIDKTSILNILKRIGFSNNETILSQKISTLSGGQKKRLQLARALLTQPECVFADEPTANSDPVSAALIEEILLTEAKQGTTIIMTTHNLTQARKLSDKVFILDKGRIIQSGFTDEIFSKNPPASLVAADYSFGQNVIEGRLSKTEEGKLIFIPKQNPALTLETANPQTESNSDFSGKVYYAIIRSEDIFVSKTQILSSARNSIKAKILELKPMGNIWEVKSQTGGLIFETVITKQSVETLELKPGAEIYLTFKATAVHIIPA